MAGAAMREAPRRLPDAETGARVKALADAPPRDMSLLRDEVTKAHARGWALTTLGGKVPNRKGWQAETPLPLADLLKHVDRRGNIGVRTGTASGVSVIDEDGADSAFLAELPKTATAITGSGHLHFYFQHAPELRNSAGTMAPKIDVRADGGQIVLPGSYHPDTGEQYRWKEGHSPEDIPLAPFPIHLLPKPEP